MKELVQLLLVSFIITTPAYILRTNLGMIDGNMKSVDGETVFEFLNIPYAIPPTGALRFKKPLTHGPWQGVMDGTKYGPSCMQNFPSFYLPMIPNKTFSEDCLVVNIYVPRNISRNANRSVMVWIHGGGFTVGQGSFFDGTYLALEGDVIIVTINYRLGFLGFMTTGDSVSPGNYGLWDQILALQWVKHNIMDYGGNPNSITIFGQSAGGISVALLTLIPQNKGLFHRAISQSGVATTLLSTVHNNYVENYREQLKLLGCNRSTSLDTVSCLRGKSPKDIIALEKTASSMENGTIDVGIMYGPVVDGDLFMALPSELIQDTSSPAYQFFRSLDYITGNCNREGSLLLSYLGHLSNVYKFNATIGIPTSVVCDAVVPAALQQVYNDESTQHQVWRKVCDKYTGASTGDQARMAMDLYGDSLFVVPSIKALDIHSKENSMAASYQYMFNRPNIVQQVEPWFTGSGHSSELFYLFKLDTYLAFLKRNITNEESRLSSLIMQYWSNFAKTGNPNSVGLSQWPEYDRMRRPYLNMDMITTTNNHVFGDRISFWLDDLPNEIKTADAILVG